MNWKRSFFYTAGVGLPVIALLSYGMTRDPRSIPSPLPGREAPLFTRAVFAPGNDTVLRMAVGDSVRLADHRDGIVIVNFWASWCLACRDEHEALSLVANRYGTKGVRFYGLLYNDFERNGVKWIEEMGGQAYPSLADPGARTAIDYGLYGVPESFVINRGRVAHKYTGPVTAVQLARLLDSLITANGDTTRVGATDAARATSMPPAVAKP